MLKIGVARTLRPRSGGRTAAVLFQSCGRRGLLERLKEKARRRAGGKDAISSLPEEVINTLFTNLAPREVCGGKLWRLFFRLIVCSRPFPRKRQIRNKTDWETLFHILLQAELLKGHKQKENGSEGSV